MIEKVIKNDLTLKRYRAFKKSKRNVLASIIFAIFLIMSLSSEFWSNNKPLMMHYKGSMYFPVVKDYHPSLFGYEDILVMNYRLLLFQEGDWALWPLIRWDPYESNDGVSEYPSEPTRQNLLGTDDRGRDVLSRLLYGFRYSIIFALLVWAFSFAPGIFIGGLMGYLGGKFDLISQRIVEVLSTVPQFFLLIILVSIFSPSMSLLVIISSAFGWIFISYYVRAEFLKYRKREFVEAARAMGSGHLRIILKHILPNALGPVLTFTPFVISGNIVGLASLDFLGFGLPAPTPSWGELLAQAEKYFTTAWWLAIYPALAMLIVLVLLNMIGEGLREAFSPKS
jgi:microcin C transport system permease protein